MASGSSTDETGPPHRIPDSPEFATDTPLRRVTPLAQIADAAVLLASDLAAGMTATMANATGGAQID
ncbi:hypothetical protein CN215_25370 [Sinorhizobium meliloti]|nr:hypothetical protein CN215_25370 [Sinorhizobium meliloti]